MIFLILQLVLYSLCVACSTSFIVNLFFKNKLKLDFSDLMNLKGLFVTLPLVVIMEETVRLIGVSLLGLFLSPYWIVITVAFGSAIIHLGNLKEKNSSSILNYYIPQFVIGIVLTYFFLIYGYFVMIAVHYLYDFILLSVASIKDKSDKIGEMEI